MRLPLLTALGAAGLLIVTVIGAVKASGIASTGLPPSLWLAYAVGATLTILVGSGLFALLFYSARHGHDDISVSDEQSF